MNLLLLALLLALWLQPTLAQNQFIIPPEGRGAYSSMLPVMPSYVDNRVLAANVNETHTIPTGAKTVVMSATCSAFYTKKDGAAAVPAADVTDGTGSAINPSGFSILDVATIGLIAPTACIVSLWFYK